VGKCVSGWRERVAKGKLSVNGTNWCDILISDGIAKFSSETAAD